MTPSRYILRRVVLCTTLFSLSPPTVFRVDPKCCKRQKSIFASGTFRYSFGELVLCVFVKMVKIFLFYLLCLFAV